VEKKREGEEEEKGKGTTLGSAKFLTWKKIDQKISPETAREHSREKAQFYSIFGGGGGLGKNPGGNGSYRLKLNP